MISVQVSLNLRLAGAVPPAPVSRLSSSVAFGKAPGAGKGGAPVPPAGAASAAEPREASPIVSLGSDGHSFVEGTIGKQFLVAPTIDGQFNVDCGRCAAGKTFAGEDLARMLSEHICT